MHNSSGEEPIFTAITPQSRATAHLSSKKSLNSISDAKLRFAPEIFPQGRR
jgi:hypothetical protein